MSVHPAGPCPGGSSPPDQRRSNLQFLRPWEVERMLRSAPTKKIRDPSVPCVAGRRPWGCRAGSCGPHDRGAEGRVGDRFGTALSGGSSSGSSCRCQGWSRILGKAASASSPQRCAASRGRTEALQAEKSRRPKFGPLVEAKAMEDNSWRSPLATTMEAWCQEFAWKTCKTCHRMVTAPLHESNLTGKQGRKSKVVQKCSHCSKGAGYPTVSPEDIPEVLRNLTENVLWALRPLEPDVGSVAKARHGYRVHTDMIRFWWRPQTVEQQLAMLEEEEECGHAWDAYQHLVADPESSYGRFVTMHQNFLRRNRAEIQADERRLQLPRRKKAWSVRCGRTSISRRRGARLMFACKTSVAKKAGMVRQGAAEVDKQLLPLPGQPTEATTETPTAAAAVVLRRRHLPQHQAQQQTQHLQRPRRRRRRKRVRTKKKRLPLCTLQRKAATRPRVHTWPKYLDRLLVMDPRMNFFSSSMIFGSGHLWVQRRTRSMHRWGWQWRGTVSHQSIGWCKHNRAGVYQKAFVHTCQTCWTVCNATLMCKHRTGVECCWSTCPGTSPSSQTRSPQIGSVISARITPLGSVLLTDYHPLEPEMTLQLAMQWFPQCFAGGTLQRFRVPVPWEGTCPERVAQYMRSRWRAEDMCLEEFLRKTNKKGQIHNYIKKAYEEATRRGEEEDEEIFEESLEAWANNVQPQGQVMVAAACVDDPPFSQDGKALDLGARVLLTAPTGRLAATMREKFPDLEVDTVHGAFLVFKPAQQTLEVMWPYDLVIVEEVGQLSKSIFERVMEQWIAADRLPTLVFVGDFFQLPGVEPTSALDSWMWHNVMLKKKRVAHHDALQMWEAAKDLGNPTNRQTFRGTAAGNQEGAQSAKSRKGRLHHECGSVTVRCGAHLGRSPTDVVFDSESSGLCPASSGGFVRSFWQRTWTRLWALWMAWVLKFSAWTVATSLWKQTKDVAWPFIRGHLKKKWFTSHFAWDMRAPCREPLWHTSPCTDMPNMPAAAYVALSRVQRDAEWRFVGDPGVHHFTPARFHWVSQKQCMGARRIRATRGCPGCERKNQQGTGALTCLEYS